jgi:N-dimethylarginine dimethylaminohydrolase
MMEGSMTKRPSVQPRFLMCRPEHFAVSYAINPWMDPAGWARADRALTAAARREWDGLHCALRGLGAAVELATPVPGLPDMVFTANAAVVLNRRVLLARFRHPQRQGEEVHFEAAFRALQAHGLVDAVRHLPAGMVLEGAGDCVFDRTRDQLWLGHGPRSDAAAREVVADELGVEVVALELADPRFYHMDTALCPLPGGELMFAPLAFTRGGLAAIHERVPAEDRIEVGDADACRLAANAVALGDTIVMSGCSDDLRTRLAERGYRVVTTPLGSFLRSGGSAFCLTLRLDLASAAPARAAGAAA